MNQPHPVEVVVPALTFTVAGWLIGGSMLGAVGGALFGIVLGSLASVAGHSDDSFANAETSDLADEGSS
jgi:hypothetical protein